MGRKASSNNSIEDNPVNAVEEVVTEVSGVVEEVKKEVAACIPYIRTSVGEHRMRIKGEYKELKQGDIISFASEEEFKEKMGDLSVDWKKI